MLLEYVPPVIDLTVLNWLITAIVAYYVLLWVCSWDPRSPRPRWVDPGAADPAPMMVILVPALNEELVLHQTLAALSALTYTGAHRVLVIDDGSTDRTGEIADLWAQADARIRVTHRMLPDARQGKSEGLNHAYRLLLQWIGEEDPWLAGAGLSEVIAVILDADGVLGPQALDRVAPYFADQECASVQIGVRIGNARANLLARMQDIEFVGFTSVVQVARDWLGSSGLGGNGQFTRLSALAELGEEPWRRGALTEDLDLGLRIVIRGWRTRFCHSTYVEQQGVETWRALWKQRTRWIQGTYQCWRYIPSLLRAPGVGRLGRFDLVLYLLLCTTVILISLTMALNALDLLGVVDTGTYHPKTLHEWLIGLAVQALLSLGLLAIFVGAYQRHSSNPFSWWIVPFAAIAFAVYGYVWLFVSLRALWNLIRGQNSWVKTERVVAVSRQ